MSNTARRILGVVIFLLGLALMALSTSCGYTLAKDGDVKKPLVNVVCWQDGKDFFKTQAVSAAFEQGYLVIESPEGAPSGVQIKMDTNNAACAVVTSPTPLAFEPPRPLKVQESGGARNAPADAGVPSDAGPKTIPPAAPKR